MRVSDVLRYRVLPLVIAFALVLLFVFVLVRLASSGEDLVEEREHAIVLAQALYAQKKAEGVDFSAGPCLTEKPDGWVGSRHRAYAASAGGRCARESMPVLSRGVGHFE